MLKITLIFLMLAVALSALAFQNEPDSFRGIEWGASINDIGDMVKIDDAGELRTYQKKNEDMKMGDAALKYLVYFFFRDKFCGSLAVYDEYASFIAIRDTLFQRHGTGQFIRIAREGEEYNWLGKDVNIILRYNERTNKGTLTYIYTPDSNRQQHEAVTARRQAQAI